MSGVRACGRECVIFLFCALSIFFILKNLWHPPHKHTTHTHTHILSHIYPAGALGGLADLRIEERLHRYMVGGRVSAAAAPHRRYR